MTQSETYRKGVEMRQRLLGDGRAAPTDSAMQAFSEVTAETVFGALWTRPGLDIKTRTLVCVVSDAATGRYPELVLHLRMALDQGWTETELIETLIHLLGYVGAPVIHQSMITASQTFAERRGEAQLSH